MNKTTPQSSGLGQLCKSPARWKALERKFWGIAYKFQTPEYPPEDVFQHIVEKVVIQSRKDPRFFEQSDTRIAQYAKWQALHLIDKAVVYSRCVEDGDRPVSDTGATLIETLSDANAAAPEQAAENYEIWREMLEVIKGLPETHQQVVYGLYIGKKQVEIARELNTTPQNVTHLINKLRTILGTFAGQLTVS